MGKRRYVDLGACPHGQPLNGSSCPHCHAIIIIEGLKTSHPNLAGDVLPAVVSWDNGSPD